MLMHLIFFRTYFGYEKNRDDLELHPRVLKVGNILLPMSLPENMYSRAGARAQRLTMDPLERYRSQGFCKATVNDVDVMFDYTSYKSGQEIKTQMKVAVIAGSKIYCLNLGRP